MLPCPSRFNAHVASGLTSLFGRTDHANCTVAFTVPVSKPHCELAQSENGRGKETSTAAGCPRQHGANTERGCKLIPDEPCDSSSNAHRAAGSAEVGAAIAGRKRKASEAEDLGTKGAAGASGSTAAAAPGAEARVIGEPLPAHTLVLCLASERFQTQVERWSDATARSSKRIVAVGATAKGQQQQQQQPQQEGVGTQPVPVPQQQPPLLELRVPLGSEEELPAALAAIQFAYTGHIEAGSICEALQVRQQADYLQMKGCVEACVAAVREKLAAGLKAAPTGPNDCGAGGSGGSAASEASAAKLPVLELYSCAHLWPDPEQEPAFAALLTEAKPQLVAHFGDALAVLNKKELYGQMRALPAVGLEALLESDDFGTDSESSVVLVLAEWMRENYSRTELKTRRRLCGLLRLALCDRTYLDWVLPALALDHLLHPNSALGWFPITPQQAGCVTRYSSTSEDERDCLRALLGDLLTGSDGPVRWLTGKRRRQCVPPQGLSFRLSLSVGELTEECAEAAPDAPANIWLDVEGEGGKCICAVGLKWLVLILYEQGSSSAGMRVRAEVPDALQPGQGSACVGFPVVLPRFETYLHVADMDGNWADDLLLDSEGRDVTRGQVWSWGIDEALPLVEVPGLSAPAAAQGEAAGASRQTQPSAAAEQGQQHQAPHAQRTHPPTEEQQPGSSAGQQQQQELHEKQQLQKQEEAPWQQRIREAAVPIQWARYLKDEEITGRFVLLPPPCDDADAKDDNV